MSNQFLKLRRSAVPGRVPSTSSIDFGEIALNTFDGLAFIKRSGSNGEEVITLGSREGAFTGSFSGSFVGNGAGLFNVPASGIVGLNLSQIATGSVSASVGVGAASFNVVSGSSTLLYVSSSGNVGIGTSTPIAKVEITNNDIVGAGFVSYGQLINSSQTTTSGVGGAIKYGLRIVGSGLFFKNVGTEVYGLNIPAYSGTVYGNYIMGAYIQDRVGIGSFNPITLGGLPLLHIGNNADYSTYSSNPNTILLRFNSNTSGLTAGIYASQGNTNVQAGVFFTRDAQNGSGNTDFVNAETNTDGTLRMRLFSNGNLRIQNGGTFTDSGDRLQVSGSSRFIGNMVITGSGNTSGTNALTIQNSVGVNAIRVRNDGSTILGQTTVHTANAPNSAQVDTIFVNSLRGSDGASGLYVNGGSSFSIFSFQASNNGAYLSLSGQYPLYLTQTRYGINIADTLNADAITATYTGLNISSVVNQVSGASGIIRGIRISPTLNSAWDYRSIEWTNNASATSGSWGLYGAGTAPNYLSGSLNIGTTTLGPNILNVNGSTAINGNTTITGSLTVSNTITAQTLVVQTITSSTDYVSGSTIFGNSLSNTHQFTGSVSITGSLSLPYLSTGSVLFVGSGGSISQNNSNFFWDNTNNGLVVGSNTISSFFRLGVNGNIVVSGTSPYITFNTATNSGSTPAYIQYVNSTSLLNILSSGAIDFYSNANNRMRLFGSTGNLSIGGGISPTDSGNRLQVYGTTFLSGSVTGSDMLIRGSGNTSGTNAFQAKNSSGTNLFTVVNDGYVYSGYITYIGQSSTNPLTFAFDGSAFTSPNTSGRNYGYFNSNTNQTGDQYHFGLSGNNLSPTSGNHVGLYSARTFAPTSGTATYFGLQLSQTINQTGGANGITRGLYINPTLTANADFRAIEWSNNASGSTSWGLYGAGSAPNYLSGSLGIGIATPIARLDVRGNTFISGTLDILDAEINYQRNNNVTTGSARLIASIPTASLNAAFFDYVIVSGSNARAGTVMSVWASSSVEWNETYTNDIGSTTDVSLYAAITGSSIGLFATSSINNIWTIKSLIRTI